MQEVPAAAVDLAVLGMNSTRCDLHLVEVTVVGRGYDGAALGIVSFVLAVGSIVSVVAALSWFRAGRMDLAAEAAVAAAGFQRAVDSSHGQDH